MKTLASKHRTRHIAASIAIATALAAAQTALAATPIYWKGGNGSETSPVNIYSKSCWTGSTTYSGGDLSGDFGSAYNMHFGFASGVEDTTAWLKCDGNDVDTAIANLLMTHSGHFIFTSGSFKTADTFSVGYTSGDDSTVTKKSGDWTIGGNLNVGHNAGSTGIVEVVGGSISVSSVNVGYSGTGTLTLNGGTFGLASSSGKRICLGFNSGSSGTLNLNGGDIKTYRIVRSKGDATINFNGGTLQANANNDADFIGSGVTVNVGERGGTIDNGGYDVTIASALGGANDTGRLNLKGSGTTTISGNNYIENGKIVVDGGTVGVGATRIGYNASTDGLVEVNGGTVNITDDLYVGYSGTGTLTINGGTVEVVSTKQTYPGWNSGSRGTINLNGGVLKTKRVANYKGPATLNFIGGTLQANADSNTDFIKNGITVNVVSGGTIDNGGFNIKIPAALSGSGRLTFKGSGTTTLSGSVSSYSGVTRVVAGSTPCVSKAIATKLLSNGLALSGTPVVGTPYTVLSCDEDLSDLSLGKVTCPVATGCTVTLGDGNTSIVVTPTGAIKSGYWTGIKDANMSDPANWSDGVVPADGADIDLSGATKVNGDLNYALGAVTMGSGVVTFTGSFTATSFSDTSKVAVGANSTVTLDNDLVFSSGGNKYVCNHVGDGGTFVVTGDIKTESTFVSYLDPCELSVGTGVVAAKGLVNNGGQDQRFRLVRSSTTDYNANWRIGANGLSGATRFHVPDRSGATACITAAADFTISANIVMRSNLIIDPAGFKVTIGNGSSGTATGGGILAGRESGLATVKGRGEVVINYDAKDLTVTESNWENAFAVEGSARLVLASGANIGTGSITLGAGTTLALTATGREFTPLANTLNLPTTGAATLRIDGTRLKSGDNIIATVGNEATTDNVTLDSESAALEGRHASLSVKEGNLVLDITPDGLMIIFR